MTPYVKWLDGFISQKVKEGYRYMWWVELRDHLSAIYKEQAAAGYHVVQEGQAVVVEVAHWVRPYEGSNQSVHELPATFLRPRADEAPTP